MYLFCIRVLCASELYICNKLRPKSLNSVHHVYEISKMEHVKILEATQ